MFVNLLQVSGQDDTVSGLVNSESISIMKGIFVSGYPCQKYIHSVFPAFKDSPYNNIII